LLSSRRFLQSVVRLWEPRVRQGKDLSGGFFEHVLWPEPAQNSPTWVWPFFVFQRENATAAGVASSSCQWPVRSPPLSSDGKGLNKSTRLQNKRAAADVSDQQRAYRTVGLAARQLSLLSWFSLRHTRVKHGQPGFPKRDMYKKKRRGGKNKKAGR
jgi:hypothetical protein